jgi:hypothetical protein
VIHSGSNGLTSSPARPQIRQAINASGSGSTNAAAPGALILHESGVAHEP